MEAICKLYIRKYQKMFNIYTELRLEGVADLIHGTLQKLQTSIH